MRLHVAVRAKLRKSGPVSQALFNAAYAYKLFLLKRGLPYGWGCLSRVLDLV